MLGDKFENNEIDIALVQEPCIKKGPTKGKRVFKIPGTIMVCTTKVPGRYGIRACMYLNPIWANQNKYIVLEQFSDSDTAVILTESLDCSGKKWKIIYCSLYCPSLGENGRTLSNPVSDKLEALTKHAARHNCILIIGADANAKNTWWGSTSCNSRGLALEDFCRLTANLVVANEGSVPTFNRIGINAAQSVIDVTLITEIHSNFISNWKVCKEATGSDHQLILMNFALGTIKESTKTLKLSTNWKKFHKITDLCLDETFSKAQLIKDTSDLDDVAREVGEILRSAHKNSSKTKTVKNKFYREWYSEKLNQQRRRINILRTKVQRLTGTHRVSELALLTAQYRIEQRSYKADCRHAKHKQWKKKMSELESIKDTARLHKLLENRINRNVTTVKRNDGVHSTNRDDTVDALMQSHFPGCIKFNPTDSNNSVAEVRVNSPSEIDAILEATSIIDIEGAVHSFDGYKAPGVDEIFPALMQKASYKLISVLQILFRKSFLLCHIPEEWTGTFVTFIPKADKDNYESTKSFRPISLMSFFLKAMEKIIDRSLRTTNEIERKINPAQHAYRPGRGTASALEGVVARLENCIHNGGKALVLFADIEGAFDKTSFEVTTNALRAKGVDAWKINWIEKMLSSRKMRSLIQNGNHVYMPRMGLGQGGCSSPILWDLVIDDALGKLQEDNFHVTCYADDITVVCTALKGQEDNLALRINKAVKILDDWCQTNGLSINPDKMKVMEFNKTRKPIARTQHINYNGSRIEKVDNFKLLGVHLDGKLNWNFHIDKAIEKGRKSLFITAHYLRLNWGINAHLARQVYKQIVLPRTTYACLFWSHRLEVKYVREKFEKLQRLALIMCTGTFRSTPSADIDFILGIPSIKLLTTKLAVDECNRLILNNLWPPYSGVDGHRSILSLRNRINNSNVSDKTSKRINASRRYETIINDRANWDDGLSNIIDQWYCDGSKNEVGVGTGIFNPYTMKGKSFRLSDNATVMQAELYGIQECANQYVMVGARNKRITILSDSQAALQALAKSTFDSVSVGNCIKILEKVTVHNKIQIRWVPGHSGINGNEVADRLANEGSTKDTIDLVSPESPATFDKALNEWLVQNQEREWREKFPLRSQYANAMIGGRTFGDAKDLWTVKRNKIRAIMAILTGHARLNKFIKYSDPGHSAACRYCESMDENVEHLIMECDQLDELRLEALGQWTLDYDDLEDIPVSDIIRFAKSAGFYHILACTPVRNDSTD